MIKREERLAPNFTLWGSHLRGPIPTFLSLLILDPFSYQDDLDVAWWLSFDRSRPAAPKSELEHHQRGSVGDMLAIAWATPERLPSRVGTTSIVSA